MNTESLIRTAEALMTPGKGILAMDESIATCHQRLAEAGIPQTEAMRKAYRLLLVTTPGLANGISGAILHDETIRQTMMTDGRCVGLSVAGHLDRAGIVPGIKVDLGTTDLAMFPHEPITNGLDGLAERVHEYASLGARFAKWRAVVRIGPGLPSLGCVQANAHALARYAAVCQQAGLVPIVEPEVLMEGTHNITQCEAVTENVLHTVFQQLRAQRVLLQAVVLKPSMVLPGTDSAAPASDAQVAEATVRCLRSAVPAAVAGVAFLSGGQSDVVASRHLNAICKAHKRPHPWPITYSFGRALQRPVLKAWSGHGANTVSAQQQLLHRVMCNNAAQQGRYSPDTETNGAGISQSDRTTHAIA